MQEGKQIKGAGGVCSILEQVENLGRTICNVHEGDTITAAADALVILSACVFFLFE